MAIRKFSGYEETEVYKKSERLPAGGYVTKIENVRYEEGRNGSADRIVLMVDIDEGEYKGFFRTNYESQTGEDKKWKGKFIIYYPKEDGTERDKWTKQTFKGAMVDFEESNPNFTWTWDEKSLIGKRIGLLARDRHSVIDGRQICYTEFKYTTTVENIKKGNFKVPEPYYDSGASTASASASKDTGFMEVPKGMEEEIPF